jgi:hypothetical protein
MPFWELLKKTKRNNGLSKNGTCERKVYQHFDETSLG